MKTLQITSLEVGIVKDQSELNVYVEKGIEYEKKEKAIVKVDKENYEDSKKLRSEVTSEKTSIENTRKALKRPLLDLGKAIDSRAEELAKPFVDTKNRLQEKIGEYEKVENDRKEKEANRITEIAEKITEIKDLVELEKFYKSLDRKDQIKKVIAESATLRKNEIPKELAKKRFEEFEEKFKTEENIEVLEKELDTLSKSLTPEGDIYTPMKNSILTNRINALKLLKIEKEKEATKEYIVSLHSITLDQFKKGDFPKMPSSDVVNIDEINTWIENRKNTLENLKLKKDLEDLKVSKNSAEVKEHKRVEKVENSEITPEEKLKSIFEASKEKITFENVEITYTEEAGFLIKGK